MKKISIDGRDIGQDYPPYIIAELSANHNGDINRAFRIMEEAKKAGAHAIKLQTYSADTITIDCDDEAFQINEGLWQGQTLYHLYKHAQMPWEWHLPLFNKAKELGISIFSTPFDYTAVDLLEKLGAPAYKVASFEIVDLPLIRYIAKTGKPIILSTGMASDLEIEEAVLTARLAGCKDLVILHCVSGYPAPAKDYNLATIPDIAAKFDVITGLSDHTVGNTTAIASVVLGASVIEKHITLDRNGGGPDDSFSLEPHELTILCRETQVAWQAFGKVNYSQKESEKENVRYRRSLYVVTDIRKGEILTSNNLKSIRPGFGLSPKYYDDVLGKRVRHDLKRGHPLSFQDIA